MDNAHKINNNRTNGKRFWLEIACFGGIAALASLLLHDYLHGCRLKRYILLSFCVALSRSFVFSWV